MVKKDRQAKVFKSMCQFCCESLACERSVVHPVISVLLDTTQDIMEINASYICLFIFSPKITYIF